MIWLSLGWTVDIGDGLPFEECKHLLRVVGVKASDYYSTVDTRRLCRQNAAVEAHSHLDKCAFKNIQFAMIDKWEKQLSQPSQITKDEPFGIIKGRVVGEIFSPLR